MILRQCPFCKGAAEVHAYEREHRRKFEAHGYRVECAGRCGAKSDYWHSLKAAQSAWNERR